MQTEARPSGEIYLCVPDPQAADHRWHTDAQLRSVCGAIEDAAA